jgi:general L-amino acid transport system permease protein
MSTLAWGWMRANLFKSWGDAALTLLALAFLYNVGGAFVSWALIEANWTGTPDECRAAAGACWSAVREKHRFILFGTYTYAEQWRPFAALLVFFGLVLASTWRGLWGRWLVAFWGLGFALMAWLLAGDGSILAIVPNAQWGGLPLTIMLALVGNIVALPMGILLALGRRSDMPAIRALCVAYIELIRGVPLISVLFMASVMVPLFLPEGVTTDKLLRAQIGIILFTAAYLAEVVRGGLNAIPKGHVEAAESLGLGYWRRTLLIVLPQALKIVIPPLVNSFIATFKDTSLVVVVGLYDLLNTTKTALNDPIWRSFFAEGFVAAALVYFIVCFFMSRYSQHLEVALATGRRA